MKFLGQAKGFILDMDGTFFLGERLLPGALDFLALLNRLNLPFAFLTNNTSRSRADYVRKLIGFGVQAADARVFTAGDATIRYLREHFDGKGVCLIGTRSLREDFRAAGVRLDARKPAVVVLGYDTELTYAKLVRLCAFVRQGLPYLATHPDVNCPTPDGPIPDIGAMVALVEKSTGRLPDKIFGKPDRNLIEQLAGSLKLTAESLVMVGDRLYTDIAMGTSAGVGTVLVLSGETKRGDVAGSPFQPDFVCENLAELGRMLEAAAMI
ncbi:MAG: HAD-IIA family hydrolase [Anaerolineaceae bacterium]